MPEKYRDIPLTSQNSEAQLNQRQLTSYRAHRRRLIDWMLNEGKDPARGDGYAQSTATMRAYRLDKFYRAVWNAESRYTEAITTAHADAWLEYIDEQEYTECYKAACSKALVTLFEWKAVESNTPMTWKPTKRFSSTRA